MTFTAGTDRWVGFQNLIRIVRFVDDHTDRALEFLIYLYNEGKETSVTQIANDLGVYKSTVFRTLTTMEARGFVKKNPETEKYWLGNRLFTLGKSVENRMGLREIVKPYVSELYDLYHEVINVSVLDSFLLSQLLSLFIFEKNAQFTVPPLSYMVIQNVGSVNF